MRPSRNGLSGEKTLRQRHRARRARRPLASVWTMNGPNSSPNQNVPSGVAAHRLDVEVAAGQRCRSSRRLVDDRERHLAVGVAERDRLARSAPCRGSQPRLDAVEPQQERARVGLVAEPVVRHGPAARRCRRRAARRSRRPAGVASGRGRRVGVDHAGERRRRTSRRRAGSPAPRAGGSDASAAGAEQQTVRAAAAVMSRRMPGTPQRAPPTQVNAR